jgi:transposase
MGMLCDFFGTVVVPPTAVEQNGVALNQALVQLRQALTTHELHDLRIAIERTGRYHRIVQRAFAAAGLEARMVHPFATKQFRQPQDPGNKTDDTDLAAIQRAAVTGFALLEPPAEETGTGCQLCIRHRRDLVGKTSALCCQIGEPREAALPGSAACFDQLLGERLRWAQRGALSVRVPDAGRRPSRPESESPSSPPPFPAPQSADHLRLGRPGCPRRLGGRPTPTYRPRPQRRSLAENPGNRASRLVHTPSGLLLSFPGITVVSAADFAGARGPIRNDGNARAITGRAGLRPSRYPSNPVDPANGPLVRCNRKLRAAILGIADHLVCCNHHLNALAHRWNAAGQDPRHTRVQVALRFCRSALPRVAGRHVFRHPCWQGRPTSSTS